MELDEKTFFSDPIPSENGVTVVILAEKVPSYLPKLADVKGKVEADYKLSQKRKLFSERASALDKALQSAKDEKSFEKIARDGGAKVSDYKDYVIATALLCGVFGGGFRAAQACPWQNFPAPDDRGRWLHTVCRKVHSARNGRLQ